MMANAPKSRFGELSATCPDCRWVTGKREVTGLLTVCRQHTPNARRAHCCFTVVYGAQREEGSKGKKLSVGSGSPCR